MPIAATCACGKKLQVKDELAGKNVRCPACKQPLRIPSAASKGAAPASKGAAPASKGAAPASGPSGGLEDLFEEEGLVQRQGATCPNCTEEMKPGAIFCINCGYNTQTGERVQSHRTEAERTVLGHSLLDKAQSDMASDVEMQRKLQAAGMPWWMLLIILLALLGLAVFFVMGVNWIKGEPE